MGRWGEGGIVVVVAKNVMLQLNLPPPAPRNILSTDKVALWGEKEKKKWENDKKNAKALSPTGDMPAAAEAAIRYTRPL